MSDQIRDTKAKIDKISTSDKDTTATANTTDTTDTTDTAITHQVCIQDAVSVYSNALNCTVVYCINHAYAKCMQQRYDVQLVIYHVLLLQDHTLVVNMSIIIMCEQL